jgi:error-prone DNA polymerase
VADFIKRIAPPRDEAENIIKCGALDSLYPNRRELLSILPYLESADHLLFASLPPAGAITDFTPQQKRFMERELLGLDIQEHFLAFMRPWLHRQGIMSSQELHTVKSGHPVQTAGLLIHPHRPPTRSGRITVFFALEDEFGLTDVTMFEDVYKRYGGEIFNHSEGVVLVRGKLHRRGRGLTVVADQAKRISIIFS